MTPSSKPPAPNAPPQRRSTASPLAEVAWAFLKLGTIAFGGPAAHIAMMEDEFVRRRRWITRDEFLDLLGAVQLIPGPNSTELAIHLGHRRAGWPGLLVAGLCFILPAAILVTAIAWAYVRFGTLPDARGILAGIQPVIFAILAHALFGFSHSALKTRGMAALGLLALIASLLRVHELAILGGAALLAVLVARPWRRPSPTVTLPALIPPPDPALTESVLPLAAGGAALSATGLAPLFGVFLKVGSVLFGSGYVLFAFLRTDLVERRGWLTEAQLVDAIAVGQFTPGPFFTTATFVGYLLAGGPGAFVATVGIFLPAFVFVALSGPLIPRLRQSAVSGAALDGVNVASLALMTAVTLTMARTALQTPAHALLAAIALLLLARFRINSAWLVLGGAAAGALGWISGT